MENIKTVMLDDFINKFETTKSETILERYMEGLITTDYISYGEKCNICKRIINSSYYIKDQDDVTRFHMNNTAAFMLYCLMLVQSYTCIVVDMSDSVNSYDKLKSNNLFNVIFNYIPESELDEFQMILAMVEQDTIDNETNTTVCVSNVFERIEKITYAILDGFTQK